MSSLDSQIAAFPKFSVGTRTSTKLGMPNVSSFVACRQSMVDVSLLEFLASL